MKKLGILLLAVVMTTVSFSTVAHAYDRVSKYDTNGDGKVDFAELSEVCEVKKSLFNRADENGDGYLSNRELREAKGYVLNRCNKKA